MESITKIMRKGQKFLDEPIQVMPKLPSVLSMRVQSALGVHERIPAPITVGHERVRLKWVSRESLGL